MNPAPPAAEALRQSATRLLHALRAHEDREYRRTLLKRLAREMGEEDYPLFLRLLCVVAESDDSAAKTLLAESLAEALRRADPPAGALSSWGATRLPDAGGPLTARQLSDRFFAGTPSRRYGPLEYLVVWLNQKTQRLPLSEAECRRTLTRLIALFDHSPAARELYAARLKADAGNALEGAYTRATRERLAALAEAWQAGLPAEDVALAACPARGPT